MRLTISIKKTKWLIGNNQSIWEQPKISVKTKINIYRAVVLSTVLYGAECWTCTKNEYAKLNVFHNKNLRRILGLRKDEIHNEDLYRKTGLPSLEDLVGSYRLRWAGHVRRMMGLGPDGEPTNCPVDSQQVRWPKKMLFGDLVEKGHPGRGHHHTNGRIA